MPGNKFSVNELWNGVKKSTSDAWNEASQGAANLLKQIQGLATKHLPQIGLILRIVIFLPAAIRNVVQLVRDIGRLFSNGQKTLGSLLGRIPSTIGKLLGNATRTIIKASSGQLKAAEKGLRSAFNAAIKPLPKNIQNGVKGIFKPPIDALKGALKDGFKLVGKIPGQITGAVSAIDKKILSSREFLFREAAKAQGKATATLNKSILSAREGLFREYTKVQGKISGELAKASKLVETIKSDVKIVGKQAGVAVEEVKKVPQTLAKTREQIVAELNKAIGKAETTIVKGAQAKIDEVGKVAKKSGAVIDDVGKQVSRSIPALEGMAKQFPKVFSHLDDILKVLGTVGKTIVSMVPIVEGIAEQLNFEEIFQRLERIERRIDDKIWPTVDRIESNTQRVEIKIDKLRQGAIPQANFQPLIDRLDRILAEVKQPSSSTGTTAIVEQLRDLRSDVGALPKSSPNATTIAEAVAAKMPKPDTGAIAEAVAAKMPKPIDNTAILTKIIQDSIKATPPGQTVSSEAIAAAVAAKIPKPDTGAIATAVKEKMGPEFKAINAKLPDNGIFRVDQAGIAIAVKEKMGPEFKAIQPAKIPEDLARKSDVKITVNPTPVTVNPTPVIVNPTPVTVNPTPVTTVYNAPPDLSPINAQLKDISKAIGVDQLKSATPVDAEKLIKQAGNQQFSGGAVQGATTLAGLMAAFAAPQFFRSGSHRLGGTFDQSLMNPAAGKVQIDDAMHHRDWQFRQIDERMGMPTQMQIISQSGAIQTQQFRSIQDSVEEINGVIVTSAQDLEIVERYLVALTQDVQKLMQITLQTREDVDVLIDDSGCKTKEVKRSHPTHIKLTAPGEASSLTNLFQQGEVHYVARQWNDSADKNQKLERMSYDTQIAAMSNKFEFHKTNPELPLDKSRATGKPQNDEAWRTFVSTMEAPPEGYVTPGNPIPDIKEIKNGNPVEVPKPTNPLKKLGK
jgi:hypothetical protein